LQSGGMMKKRSMIDMTWQEFRDRVNDSAVAVIPLGSIELEGLHLPIGVDTIVADGIADRIAEEPGVIICPTLPIGYSKWFTPFPGTISLEHETLTRLLLEYSNSLIQHGVRRLVFLNAHYGNNSSVEVAAHNLIAAHAVHVGMVSIWKLSNDLIAGTDLITEGKFTHAGEIMTSVVMALKPQTVLNEKIRKDHVKSPAGTTFLVKNSTGETAFKNSIQPIYQDIRELTETGILGDPTAANKEKGEKLLDLITDYLKAYLQEFRKLPLKMPENKSSS